MDHKSGITFERLEKINFNFFILKKKKRNGLEKENVEIYQGIINTIYPKGKNVFESFFTSPIVSVWRYHYTFFLCISVHWFYGGSATD